jgi:hypothetical protein
LNRVNLDNVGVGNIQKFLSGIKIIKFEDCNLSKNSSKKLAKLIKTNNDYEHIILIGINYKPFYQSIFSKKLKIKKISIKKIENMVLNLNNLLYKIKK